MKDERREESRGDSVLIHPSSFILHPSDEDLPAVLGGGPVRVDVAPGNWNLDVTGLEAVLGPATRAVIVSHLHGGLVPMRELMEVCLSRGIVVIEDAAQAPGARVQGRLAGTWGDVAVISF